MDNFQDNVIFRNISHEIMRECTNKGIKISDRFSAYYVKLLLLDPKWHISLDNENINRVDLQTLVKYAIGRLVQENTPSVVGLKMQMYFTCSFDTSVTIIAKHRDSLKNKLLPLANEILSTACETEDDFSKLRRKIVYYITLIYGLGNPADPLVYREAEVAFNSLFDANDMNTFLETKGSHMKHDILWDNAYLLAGVRLFNRDCTRGGQGIEDIPTLLTQAINLTHSNLETTLTDIMENVNILTTALDNSYVFNTKGARTVLDLVLPISVFPEHVDYAKDLLFCYRQFEIYTRKMQIEMEKLDEKSQAVFDHFQWCLIDVHRCVQYKTAVPANIVYPLFTKLALTWHNMQDMVIYLSKLHQILVNLQTYMKQIPEMETILHVMIGDKPILTDADRLNEDDAMHRVGNIENPLIHSPSQISDFESKPLELLGFCVWKFVESQGALIPGNPSNGVVVFDARYYIFSSLQAARAFLTSPRRCISGALDIVRRKPELTHFLELYDQLESVKTIDQLVTKIVDPIVTNSVEIQTDLHELTRMKDPEYMWNVWDLKKKALHLADISRRRTRATQTVLSNNRTAVRIQTHYTKDHCYQTKKDNYSNVPTLSNFIFGLRGRTDDKQFIITLTRPVEE